MQIYVLDSIFGRICHPFLKYEQNTYTYEQHGSLMLQVSSTTLEQEELTLGKEEAGHKVLRGCTGEGEGEGT